MKVIRADALGLCFGVRDALAVARETPDPQDVTIHGELVHNETVLVQLENRGFAMAAEESRDAIPGTSHVMITAHGVSDRERARLEAAGKTLIDTTCPLVTRVHKAARTLQSEGWHVLVIGRHGHVEVAGIVEDLARFDVIGCNEDVLAWPHRRLGIVCQTTTPPRMADALIALIRERNPSAAIRVMDTICQPTRDRQEAVERLCQVVDAVVVVGGARSNNTKQLVSLCERLGCPALHVQSAEDIDPGWLRGRCTIGLTAGTSTLDETVDAVEARLLRLGAN